VPEDRVNKVELIPWKLGLLHNTSIDLVLNVD